MAQMYGRVARTEGMCEGSGGTAYWDTKIYERQGTSISNYNTNSAINVENASTNLERVCKVNGYTDAGVAQANQFYGMTWGICPHGVIPLLMIDPRQNDEPDYLDTKAMADIYVEGTEGASTGNWYICTDELEKNYPT